MADTKEKSKPKGEAGRPVTQIIEPIPDTFENVAKATVAPWPPKAVRDEKPADS